MKKLLTIAALAACVPVFAAAVESANVVGYQKLDITEGWSMVTPVFKNLDGQVINYPLSKIVPVGANISGDGDITVQVMDSDGKWGGKYYWFTIDGWDMEEDGWYTIDEEPTDATLKAGEAVMVNCQSADVQFRVLGEVELEDAPLAVSTGWEMFGNASPVPVHISEIVPQGSGISGDGDITIQFMDADGKWAGKYYWFTVDGWDMEEDGWYTIDEEPADVTVNPGDSFMLNCQTANVSLVIPSPLDAGN